MARAAAIRILANAGCLAKHGITTDELIELFTTRGLEASVVLLDADDEAVLAELREHAPAVVVAAGGDGTVNRVVNLIAPLRLPLGVLPLGTANDFARGLGLPLDLAEAVGVIAGEVPIAIDIGHVHGDEEAAYFVNAAHLGLGVETAKRIDPQLKRWLGPVAYGMAAVQAWREAPRLVLEVCVDDACTHLEASQLLVGVGRYFGGGNQVGKDALDTGMFEVYVLNADLGATEALGVAFALRRGTLGDHDNALHVSAPRLSVRLAHAAEINLDGELGRMGRRLDFEVLPGGLSVYAPATAPEIAFTPWLAGIPAGEGGPYA